MPAIVKKSRKQKQSEADVDGFRQDLGPFVVAAESTRMAMLFTDAKAAGNPIIFANESFLKLTGYERAEVLGQPFNFLMERGANLGARPRINEAFAGDHEARLEILDRRKDGTTFWAAIFINQVCDESGEVVQHFASLVDLTEQKQEAEHLRFLLDELNHRTQNTLATVQAIATQTLRGANDQALVDAFEGRILALSKAHGLLGSENWTGVSLPQVIERILEPFGLNDPQGSRFTVDGPKIRLSPKAALTFAMVFNELATNAAKYGALSRDAAGRIEIHWTLARSSEGDRLHLLWQEADGPQVEPPAQKGFGSRLIQGLAQELNGKVQLSFEPLGLRCDIEMPLPRGARAT